MTRRHTALVLSLALNVALAALLLWTARRPESEARAAAPVPPVVPENAAPERVTALSRAPAPALVQPPAATAGPISVSPGPTHDGGMITPPSSTGGDEGGGWLAGFDRAMDREFERLEEREKSSADDVELKTLGELKAALTALDQLWARADGVSDPAELARIETESRKLMGDIIRLGRTDRNQRLSRLAHDLGITDEAAIVEFINSTDRIFAETDLDWAALFKR